MNRSHRYIQQWGIALLALFSLAGIASCSSATAPDGTTNTPGVGTTYNMTAVVVQSGGNVPLGNYVVTVTPDNIFNFPLRQFGATFVDSSSAGKTTLTTYRYLANGDIAIHQGGFNVSWDQAGFPSYTFAIPDSFIVFSTGSKVDRGYTLLDTLINDNVAGQPTIVTMSVVDSVFFQGPASVLVGSESVGAVKVELQQTITARGTRGTDVKTQNAVYRYNGWYSPRLGYMVQEQANGSPGVGNGNVVLRTMTSYVLK